MKLLLACALLVASSVPPILAQTRHSRNARLAEGSPEIALVAKEKLKWEALKTNSPLWTRHDRAGRSGAALSSHAFVKNLKRYAREAGVGDVHLHQTRHSFARIVAEETGSITDTQDALGHRNAATTRVYVRRIALKRDKHSSKVTDRLK